MHIRSEIFLISSFCKTLHSDHSTSLKTFSQKDEDRKIQNEIPDFSDLICLIY